MATPDSTPVSPQIQTLWIVISVRHDVIGCFSDLSLAKSAVKRLHKKDPMSKIWGIRWDSKTYFRQIVAYWRFPSDYEEERIATIYRILINKEYWHSAFGESVDGS